MRTVVLGVGGREGNAYPLTLREMLEDGTSEDVLAHASMPADWSQEEVPPGVSATTPQALREFFLRNVHLESFNFRPIGNFLHGLLARGDVGETWRRLRGEGPLRTVLDLADPEVALVPWELLADGPTRLFLSERHPVVRGRPLHAPRHAPHAAWPLRILMVVGHASGSGMAAEEQQRICDLFLRQHHAFEHILLELPTRDELLEKLRTWRPDVIHFIGHGQRREDGSVRLQIEHASPWHWGPDDIVFNLRDHAPRLAFLNACRSAGEESLWSIADAFIRAGTWAVVAMQADVEPAAAARFACAAYESLCNGKHLDEAVAMARQGLYEQGSLDKPDWAIPYAWCEGRPETVFPSDPALRQVAGDEQFHQIRHFVDRIEQRERVREHLLPPGDRTPSNLLVLRGDDRVGKTSLLLWTLRACALRSHRVAYLDLRGKQRATYFDVLGRILRGLPGHPSITQRPLVENPRYPFDLERTWKSLRSQGWKHPPAPGADPAESFPDLQPEDLVGRVYEAFRGMLLEALGDDILVIGLDHHRGIKGGVSDEAFDNPGQLPALIRDIASGGLPPVRMLLTVSPSGYDEMELHSLSGQVTVDVPYFPGEEYRKLVSEYLLHHGRERAWIDAKLPGLVSVVRRSQGDWKPGELQAYHMLAASGVQEPS